VTFVLLAAGDFGFDTGKLSGYLGLVTGIDAILVGFIQVLNATAGHEIIQLSDPIIS
jgi:succinate-acetate transporter protein